MPSEGWWPQAVAHARTPPCPGGSPAPCSQSHHAPHPPVQWWGLLPGSVLAMGWVCPCTSLTPPHNLGVCWVEAWLVCPFLSHCHSLAPAGGCQSPSPWSPTCCSFHCSLPGCEAAGAMRDGGECSGIPADGGSTKALTTQGVSNALEQPQFLSQPGRQTTLVLPSLGQIQLWSFQAWFHTTMKPHSLRSAASLLTLLPGRFSSSHQGRYVPVHFGEKGITQPHL